MTPSTNTTESARHLEVTAIHDVYIHDAHALPEAIKPLVIKHQLHGQIPSKSTHYQRAKPFIDLRRGDHHHE